MATENLREAFASECHDHWASYMLYFLRKLPRDTTGVRLLSMGYAAALEHQAMTPYDQLSEEEKELDRVQADKFLSLLERMQGEEDGSSPHPR